MPVRDPRMLDEIIVESLWRARLSAWLLGLFAFIAVVMASIGLYGLINYSVKRRTQELGLRVALGATPVIILKTVIGEGFKLTTIGLIIGIGISVVLSHFISNRLFGVTPTDSLTYICVSFY